MPKEKKTEIYGQLQFVLLVELNVQEARYTKPRSLPAICSGISQSNYTDRLEKSPFTSAGRVETA